MPREHGQLGVCILHGQASIMVLRGIQVCDGKFWTPPTPTNTPLRGLFPLDYYRQRIHWWSHQLSICNWVGLASEWELMQEYWAGTIFYPRGSHVGEGSSSASEFIQCHRSDIESDSCIGRRVKKPLDINPSIFRQLFELEMMCPSASHHFPNTCVWTF